MSADLLHQFATKPIFDIKIGAIDISYTNASLMMTATVLLILSFMHVITRTRKPVPTRAQAGFEQFYNLVFSTVTAYLGKEGKVFFPYVFSLFLFIFLGNTLGLVPHFFTFTSHIAVTLTLALIVFVSSIIIGFWAHGLKFLKHFMPSGVPVYLAPLLVPVEIISFCTRPISLSVRLFANMVAGHVMIKVFAGFFTILFAHNLLSFLSIAPLLMNVIVNGFELMVCFLQAYVFTILTCIYLNDALHIH